ncbi:MAG: DUF1194 domain-containing protein [Xanthobacteraceae bacterium]
MPNGSCRDCVHDEHAAMRGRLARSAWLFALCAVLAVTVFAAPVLAQNQTLPGGLAPTGVSIALVLAVDCSYSVSNDRFELQKRGYAAAFRNLQVLNAIRSLGTQSIAVTMFQWTGPLLHVVVADWTLIKDEASADAFADTIAAAPRRLFRGGTSISGAIDYARVLFAQSRYKGARRIIDVSGDGSNNSGRPATAARDEAVADGIGINGLPILTVEPGLDHYYRDNVIGGPGAFMIPVANYDSFADAILKKLIDEIAVGPPRADQIFLRGPSQTRPSLRKDSVQSSVSEAELTGTKLPKPGMPASGIAKSAIR